MHGRDVAEHHSVRSITLNRSVSLMQSLPHVVELFRAIQLPHEPEISPCSKRWSRNMSESPIL
jgi:hypothetical protein